MLKEMPKVGDKVKYIGESCEGISHGEIREITGIDEDGDAFFYLDHLQRNWYIQNSGEHCDLGKYELIKKAREDFLLGPAEIAIDGVKYMGVISEAYDDGGDLSINVSNMVPVESGTSPQTDRDLIIELAYTVSKLERKVSELEERDLNHGENIVNIRDWFRELDDKAEMLIDDVVMLDERTQPLTDDGAKEFAEGLSDVIEEYVNDRITRDQIRSAYD